MLVGPDAEVFQLDVGASGYYGYEVMDTCRPIADAEVGDSDLALLSYLDCCEAAFKEYSGKVANVDYKSTFDYLSFHTPFGGMVKGAHRMLMRKIARAPSGEIEADFKQRVEPGLHYCQRVGNIMGGTVFLALASTVNYGDFSAPRRVGLFSYGSGCCSEFYSGVVTPGGQKLVQGAVGARELARRYKLNISQYESLIREAAPVQFGTRNVDVDLSFLAEARPRQDLLFLHRVREYHREYERAA
jgi:polyketide biosynthesis 3-hydroxy-3-methylglutaryl-CoA synthase-like enzyme PksG